MAHFRIVSSSRQAGEVIGLIPIWST